MGAELELGQLLEVTVVPCIGQDNNYIAHTYDLASLRMYSLARDLALSRSRFAHSAALS